jgi:hypothetical protein
MQNISHISLRPIRQISSFCLPKIYCNIRASRDPGRRKRNNYFAARLLPFPGKNSLKKEPAAEKKKYSKIKRLREDGTWLKSANSAAPTCGGE